MGERLTPQEIPQESTRERPKFGNMLRILRKRQGISVTELARRIGVTPAAVTQWEHGNRKPERMESRVGLLQNLNPTEDEKSKLLEFMGIQHHIPEPESVDLILSPLEKRLSWAERMNATLANEIEEMRSLVYSLRMSLLPKKEVASRDNSIATPNEPKNLGGQIKIQ